MTLASFTQVAAEFPWFFPMFVFGLGACIGSFLNVVIYRLPLGKSVVTPGSHCACGHPIAWYDNIPILSWFILRGKARCCGRAYSFRYPFVELLTALLFLACWLLFPPAKAGCGMILLSALLAATFIDLDHMIIPDVFTLGLGVFGVLLSFLVPALHEDPTGLIGVQHSDFFAAESLRAGIASLQGLLVGSGLVLWIGLLAEVALKKEAMGFGDVKFVGAIGAFIGWQGAVFAIFGGAVVGTLWLGLAFLWQKLAGKPSVVAPRAETPEGETTSIGFGAHVPFGPMLAIAGALYFLGFYRYVTTYLLTLREIL
jgi:leader peptidase (prepilin peptidase) / N-methyltransferase